MKICQRLNVPLKAFCTGRARLPYHVDQEQNLPSNTGRAVRAAHFDRSTGSKFTYDPQDSPSSVPFGSSSFSQHIASCHDLGLPVDFMAKMPCSPFLSNSIGDRCPGHVNLIYGLNMTES